MDIFDIVGWIGMILVLLAYILLSTNKLNNGITYQLLNLVAAALMAIGLYPKNAWFSFTCKQQKHPYVAFRYSKLRLDRRKATRWGGFLV